MEDLSKNISFDEQFPGPKGDKGDRGEKGDKGDRGEQGIQGEKGEKGDMGERGKNGLTGLDGLKGKDGKNGDNGSPDTPKQIVDKLNTQKDVVNFSVIKGGQDIVDGVARVDGRIKLIDQRWGSHGGGTGGGLTKVTTDLTLTGQGTVVSPLSVVATGTSYIFSDSITASGPIVTLVGDSASLGNSQYYGTNASGTSGFYSLPSGGVSSITGTAPITSTASGSVITVAIPQATASVNGFLDSTDWNTFNNKADYAYGANNFVGTGNFELYGYSGSSFTTPPTTAARSNFTGCLGFNFQPTQDTIVTQLGRLYVAGNTGNHVAYIWDVASGAKLTSGTILAASTSDANNFKWVAITPILLTANKTYILSIDETNGGDTWKDTWSTAGSMTSNIIVQGSNFATSNNTLPTNLSPGVNMYDTGAMTMYSLNNNIYKTGEIGTQLLNINGFNGAGSGATNVVMNFNNLINALAQNCDINAVNGAIRIIANGAYANGPSWQFWPTGTATQGMYFDAGSSSGADIHFRLAPSGNDAITVKQGSGRVGFGNNTSPGYTVDVTGDINCSGVFRNGGTAGINATVTYVDTVLGAKTLTFVGGILTSQA